MKLNITKIAVMVIIILSTVLSKTMAQTSSNKWITIETVNNTSISYRLGNCQGENKMYLKIINNNNKPVTVNWSFWGSTNSKSIVMNAGETKMGDCNINAPTVLDEIIPKGQTIANLKSSIKVN